MEDVKNELKFYIKLDEKDDSTYPFYKPGDTVKGALHLTITGNEIKNSRGAYEYSSGTDYPALHSSSSPPVI